MAKKKSKSGSSPTKASQDPPVLQGVAVGANESDASGADPSTPTKGNSDYEDEVAEEEMELLQVDLGDMIKMKQVLDEGVSASLLDHVPENYQWDNVKLLLMFVSCAFAMTAQFAPIPFPESRPVLGVCGTLYFVLSGILQFITTFIDKDMILLTNPLPKPTSVKDESNSNPPKKSGSNKADTNTNSSTTINPLLYEYGLRVRSNFPRFSEFYTMILEFRIPKDDPLHSSIEEKSVKAVWSVGKFFDKEGYFDEVGLSNEVTKLFKRLEAQDYNGKESDKASKKKTE
ncbi:hypothetical protein ACA910_021949 [Epithemia clementina (nom. ined.)]